MWDSAASQPAQPRPLAGSRAAWHLTTREAALALGRSVSTVRRAIAQGRLPATRGPDGYRIDPDDLAHYAGRHGARLAPTGGRDIAPGNLPWPRTELVGRKPLVAAARGLLLDQAVPLLTLIGPAGVGKTRLALAVGHEIEAAFIHGAVFVNLAPITDPDQVLSQVALTLGVRESGDRPLAEQIAAFLRPRQLLLILDNCEQVLGAAPAFARLLASCPAVQLLATSRAPLRIHDEHLLPVPPLALPDATRAPTGEAMPDAMVLFSQRARAIQPEFAVTERNARDIADICIRLDGLPLALELAATRLRLLSPQALLALLSHRLMLLTDGARDRPDRQRTLRDAIAWSYELLAPAEQALFRRLAVFNGGFTVDSATAVSGGSAGDPLEALSVLIDQSLVQRVAAPEGSIRYALLETIREFAWERLREAGEEDATRRAHAAYFLDLAVHVETVIYGPEMSLWLDRLAEEWPNLQAALAYLVGSFGELRLAGLMSEFWSYRGRMPDGIAALTRALERNPDAPPSLLARGHSELAILCIAVGESERALAHSAASLPPARAAGDPYRLAQLLFIRALAVGHGAGQWSDAVTHLEEARMQAGRLDVPARALTFVLQELGFVWLRLGDRERGVPMLEEALALQLNRGLYMEAGEVTAELGRLDYEAGNRARAAARYADSLGLLRQGGSWPHLCTPLIYAAELAVDVGHAAAAAKLVGMTESIQEQTGAALTRHIREIRHRIGGRAGAALGPAAYAALTEAEHHRPIIEALAEAQVIAEALRDPATMPIPAPASSAPSAAPAGLSRREQEVLALLCQRLTNAEIAEHLCLSPRTVESHVAHLFAKLDVSNRRDAVAIAAKHRLIEPPN